MPSPSAEGRLRIAAAQRASWADPEKRAKRLAAVRKNARLIWADPEKRAKHCAALAAGHRRRRERLAAQSANATPTITMAPDAGGQREERTTGILGQLPRESRARYLAAEDVARRCVPLLAPQDRASYIDDFCAMLDATKRYVKVALRADRAQSVPKPEKEDLETLAIAVQEQEA